MGRSQARWDGRCRLGPDANQVSMEHLAGAASENRVRAKSYV
jgi:hypothetical protein